MLLLAAGAVASFTIGTDHTPRKVEANVPAAPLETTQVRGTLQSDAQALPLGSGGSVEGPHTVAAVEVSDTGNVVVVPVPEHLEEGDTLTLHRTPDLGGRQGTAVAGAVQDGTWLKPTPWAETAADPAAARAARVKGTFLVLALCGIVPLLLLARAYSTVRPSQVRRTLETTGLPLDPTTGPLTWKRLAEGAARPYKEVSMLALAATGLLVMSAAMVLLGDRMNVLSTNGLLALVALSAGVVLVGGGVVLVRERALTLLARALHTRMLPPVPAQPAWILTLPEGRRARKHLRRKLDAGQLEVALVLATEGTGSTVGELAAAARGL